MITFNAWFFVSSLFTRLQDLLSLLRFVAYCIVFFILLCCSFFMVETSSHSTFVVIPYSFYVP